MPVHIEKPRRQPGLYTLIFIFHCGFLFVLGFLHHITWAALEVGACLALMDFHFFAALRTAAVGKLWILALSETAIKVGADKYFSVLCIPFFQEGIAFRTFRAGEIVGTVRFVALFNF